MDNPSGEEQFLLKQERQSKINKSLESLTNHEKINFIQKHRLMTCKMKLDLQIS